MLGSRPPPEEPGAGAPAADEETLLVDVIADELALARAQLDSGLTGVAEGQLRRHMARIEADGGAADEQDATRLLLAESLWRQGRVMAAGAVLEVVSPASPQRRRPIARLIRAEVLAAAGDLEAARGVVDEIVAAIGADGAWRLRGGVASRLPWPTPPMLRPGPARPDALPVRPAVAPAAGPDPGVEAAERPPAPRPIGERTAAGRARLEAARLAYAGGDTARGDRELSLGVRLDPGIAADGVALIEPTLGERGESERLLLYGDLLRAAGRPAEGEAAYDRAAGA